MIPAQPRHPLALLAERVNSEHTRTLAEVARFAHGLETDQHTELIRIVQAGIQRRDESAKALRAQAEAEAGSELSENDVVSIPDGSMYTRSGEFTADIFRSSNDVRNEGVPLMTMQVYGPDYEETTDFISFYFERDKVQELHTLLGRFLALPALAQAGGES